MNEYEQVLRKTGGKIALLTLSKVITLLLSVVTSMILSRGFSLTIYGTYSEILTISSLTVSIFSIGIPSSLNYFLPQKEGEKKAEFLSFYYLVVSIISLVIFIVLLCTRGLISDYYKNPTILVYSFALIILPWTKIIISSRGNMLVTEGKLKKEFIYCVSNSVLLVAIASFTLVFKNNMHFYMILYVAVESLFAILVYLESFLISKKKIVFNIKKEDVKSLLAFSIPLGLSTAISTISLDLDKLIIGFFRDEASVAIYANAGKELPFSIIATSFTAVILPQIVLLVKHNKFNEAVNKWRSQIELCFAILLFCAAASIVFAPQIITILYSEEYLGGVTIFRIYSLTLMFRITYWGMLLNAFGKTKSIFYNSLICIAFNIIVSIGLYYWIGFEGPAVGSLLGVGLMSLLNIIQTKRVSKQKIKNIIPFLSFVVPSIICVVSGVGTYILVRCLKLGVTTKDLFICIGIGLVWLVAYFSILLKPLKRSWNAISSNNGLVSQQEIEKNGDLISAEKDSI